MHVTDHNIEVKDPEGRVVQTQIDPFWDDKAKISSSVYKVRSPAKCCNVSRSSAELVQWLELQDRRKWKDVQNYCRNQFYTGASRRGWRLT